tara:strand:+ start:3767 stop:4243 length:477 start_codon:yes stop_codon:yes gene_type:complete
MWCKNYFYELPEDIQELIYKKTWIDVVKELNECITLFKSSYLYLKRDDYLISRISMENFEKYFIKNKPLANKPAHVVFQMVKIADIFRWAPIMVPSNLGTTTYGPVLHPLMFPDSVYDGGNMRNGIIKILLVLYLNENNQKVHIHWTMEKILKAAMSF